MGRMVWGWDGGGMEVPTLAGAGLGAPPLSLEVWVTGSVGRRQEAVAATNFVIAAKAWSICVRSAE